MTDVIVSTTNTVINVTVETYNTTVTPEVVSSTIVVQAVSPDQVTVVHESEQGPPGPPNSLDIGTVTTLSPGESATASITGTAPNQILNLGIPEGKKGDKGDTGEGVPSGGVAGQFVKKGASTNEWANITKSDVIDLASDLSEIKSRVANALTSGLLVGGDPTVYEGVSAVSCLGGKVLIVRNIADGENATYEVVSFPSLDNVEPDFLTTEAGTFFYVNDDGQWEQYASVIDAEETLVPIFWVAHYGGVITDYGLFEPYPILNLAKQFHDYLEDVGAFSRFGNLFLPNANLTINRTSGMIVDGGAGYAQDKNSPNRYFSDAISVVSLNPTYYDGAEWVYPAVTTNVDTIYYNDISSGLELIPSGRWVNIYIYMYLDKSHDILYPQKHYASREDAISATDDLELLNEDIEYNIRRCKITVQQGCTDLSDTDCATFTPIDRFTSSTGGGGGGGGGEVNTASNVGTEGVEVFDSKVGVDLRFRKTVSKSTEKLTITHNPTNKTIEHLLLKSFEDIAQNAYSYPEALTYDGDGVLQTKTWTTPNGNIVCTYAYDVNGVLQTKTLSGAGLPTGVPTVKVYTYTGDNLTSKTYS